MAVDPRELIADLRAAILQLTDDINSEIRNVAYALSDFDEELDPLFAMPQGDIYSSSMLFRFDRAIRHFIRLVVRLKVDMHRYQEAVRPLERQLIAATRGPALDQRSPLIERRSNNHLP